ncbi:MAG: (2Fe-2S)-binding protein [Pseudomonadota bacterium]
MHLTINGAAYDIPVEWQGEPLLTVLRDLLGMTGTKFGCGKGFCGACTVHLDGTATRSCLLPARTAVGARITTIEGLADGDRLHPVQQAWIEHAVPQCGYCQPGQMMTAASLLNANAQPSASDVTASMSGNLCRCGTYPRIRKAVLRAAELAREAS